MANNSGIEMLQYPLGISNSDNAFYKNRKIVFMAINGQALTDKGKYLTTTGSYSGTYDKDYINKTNNSVHDKLLFSKNILLNDSYKYIK